MKFLIDRCAGRRLADWLREQGHDVVEVQDRGADPGDRQILAWAAAEQRIVVTMDKDFGELIFVEQQRHYGLVRLPDVPARDRIALIQEILTHHSLALEQASVITVSIDRIRIARPFM